MITYNKIGWGLPLLFRLYGSAFPRSFPPAAISAGITVLFYLTLETSDRSWWRHPYPFQIFAYIVGFIVIFRCDHLLQSPQLRLPELHFDYVRKVLRTSITIPGQISGRS